MLKWIKTHKLLFLLLCLMMFIILIGIPFVINLLFKANININIFKAEWSAGDVLSYYGAVLSFIGTVILGALALYQNHIIREESKQKEHIENMPKFHLMFGGSHGFCCKLGIKVKNISPNIAYNVNIYDVRIKDGIKNIWTSEETFSFPSITPQDIKTFNLKSPDMREHKELFLIANMSCKDKYESTHEYLLKIKCVYPNEYTCEEVKEIT